MASVKLVLRPYINNEGEQSINVRISHNSKNRFISTGVSIDKKFWNDGKVKKTHGAWLEITKHLEHFVSKYNDRIYELERRKGSYTVDDILKIDKEDGLDFLEFFEQRYLRIFEEQRQYSSHKRIKSVLKKLRVYTNGRMRFDDLTVSFLHDYENHLRGLGNKTNTVNSNLKVIRTVLEKAFNEGKYDRANNPFSSFKMKKEEVYKEKLDEQQIQHLLKTEVNKKTLEIDAKHYFLACYYLAGMRFGDLASLKGKNLVGNKLTYLMNKTSRRMELELDPLKQKPLFEIFEYYRVREKGDDDYLFPILKGKHEDEMIFKKDISTANALMNKNLKKVALKAGLGNGIGFHIARHSFADISRKKGINIYDISKMLGHASIKQTEDYLKSLDTETFNAAYKKAYE